MNDADNLMIDLIQEKDIGGSPHIKVPCCGCNLKIWVPKYYVQEDGTSSTPCSDCDSKYKSRRKVGRSDVAAEVDLRYNGS